MAGQIRAQGGDDLWAWKGNHHKAYTTITPSCHQHLDPHLPWRHTETCFDACDDAHGRTIRRRVGGIPDLPPLPALATWPALQSGMVVETMRAASPGARIPRDDRLDMASLIRSATACVTRMRPQWAMEHKLHGS
jgi:hypothetical protein